MCIGVITIRRNTLGSNFCVCFFQAEDGIRDLVRSRGLGDVYKRQTVHGVDVFHPSTGEVRSDGADGIACWFIDTDYNLSLIHI